MEANVQVGVIYARYSSAGQRDESIEGQLRDCYEYAKRYGIRIIGEYCDRAVSGTTDRRPEFQRLIRDSKRKIFNTLLVWKNDRFARSRYDSAFYKRTLRQNGVQLVAVRENISNGPDGILQESLLEGLAEYFSANLSQNVKRGNYDSALKRQTLGHVPLGYRANAAKQYEIDTATAPIIRRIYEEYAAGRAAVEIYHDLNREGYRTAYGKEFTKNSIRNILNNEKYTGLYVYEDIRDEHGIPAIIDRELFDRVQGMLDRHHRAPAAKNAECGFLLTGKLFCGSCGEPMVGDSGTGKSGKRYYYYSCAGRLAKRCEMKRISKDGIEDTIVGMIIDTLRDDQLIETIADRYMDWQTRQADTSTADALRARLRQVEISIRNVMSAIESGLITDSLKTRLMELEREKADIETGISREEMRMPAVERDTIVWFLGGMRDGDRSDPFFRMQIIDTFLRAAYVYSDGRIVISISITGEDRSASSPDVLLDAAENGERLCSDFAQLGLPKADLIRKVCFYFCLYMKIVQIYK